MAGVAKQTDEETCWKLFMNVPGPQAVALLETATKILVARNIIKPPRKREAKPKGE